jgi:hypothetical protein
MLRNRAAECPISQRRGVARDGVDLGDGDRAAVSVCESITVTGLVRRSVWAVLSVHG